MPVSGLIITYSAGTEAPDAADAIGAHPDIDLGERRGNRQAAVVDTASREQDRGVWEWLNALPGVEFVDVACIRFDDDATDEPGDASGTGTDSRSRAHATEVPQ